MTIKTAGDLRGFLADVLVGISNGTIDVAKAGRDELELADRIEDEMHGIDRRGEWR